MKKLDMAKIGPSHGTKIERLVQKRFSSYVWAFFNDGTLPGSPDLAVVDIHRRVAVFADGRFWHDSWYMRRAFAGNAPAYWKEKLQKNMMRDRKVNKALIEMGFVVIRVNDDTPEWKICAFIEDAMDLQDRMKGNHFHGCAIRLKKTGTRMLIPWTKAKTDPWFVGDSVAVSEAECRLYFDESRTKTGRRKKKPR